MSERGNALEAHEPTVGCGRQSEKARQTDTPSTQARSQLGSERRRILEVNHHRSLYEDKISLSLSDRQRNTV